MTLRTVVLVGCGAAGRGWIKALKAEARCQIVGLVDIRPDAARAATEEHGLPGDIAFGRLDEAIRAAHPDFVCDITVPEAHHSTTLTALELGVPVLGEKPLAHSMEAAHEMLATSERTGRLLMTSQSRRYNDHHRALRTAIRSGEIGAVTTATCEFFLAPRFGGFRDEMASPLLFDMAIHHFDLCRFLTGLDPVSVYAHEFNPTGSWYRGAAAAGVIFEMTGGVMFSYVGSWCAEGLPTSWNGDWRIVGDRGTLLYEADRFPHGQRAAIQGTDGIASKLENVAVAPDPGRGDGIAGALTEFLDALDGGPVPQGEVHDNIRSLAMVLGALESSRSGSKLEVIW